MLAFIIAFVIAGQIFILGPLSVVFGNNERSTITLSQMAGWPLLATIASTAILGTILWAVRKRWRARPLAITSAFALYLMIQYQYLKWDFGVFDGRQIDFWAEYFWHGAVEIGIFAALVLLAIVIPAKFLAFTSRAVPALFALLLLSVAWQALSSEQDETGGVASSDFFKDDVNHDVLSLGDRNAIIVLLDTFQGDVFEATLAEDPELRRKFDGFTLYNNATGSFPYTGLSIPALLSGESYTGGNQKIPDYRKVAGEKRMEAVFENAGMRSGRIPLDSRPLFLEAEEAECRAYGAIYDTSVFRQLPVFLKASFYEAGDLQFQRRCGSGVVPANPSEQDLAVFKKLTEETVNDGGKPKAVYIHLWGMHPPANLDADCSLAPPSSSFDRYRAQAHCMLSQVGSYFDHLREIGAFENSAVFLVADHGSKYGFMGDAKGSGPVPGYVISSANPTVAFHAPGNKEAFAINSAPVMLTDVYPTIMKEFGIETAVAGKDLKAATPNDQRVRPFTYYKGISDIYGDYIPQVERFEISGMVRDPSSWKSLGAESRLESSLEVVDFGTKEASDHLNMSWSEEAAGVPVSWILASPATLSGVLPKGHEIKTSMKIMNPHANQKMTFSIEGKVIGEITEPKPTVWVERAFSFSTAGLPEGKPVSIQINVADVSPAGGGRDTRNVGVAFDWVKFEPTK